MRIKLQDLIKTLQGFSADFVAFRDDQGELFIANFTPNRDTLFVRLSDEEEEPGEEQE